MGPDFYIIPRYVKTHPELNPVDGFVYAVIYWFEHLKNEKCTAGNSIIGKFAGVEERTVRASLERLEKTGCIKREYFDKTRKRRKEIRALVRFGRFEEVGSTEPTVGSTEPTQVGSTEPHIDNKDIYNSNRYPAEQSSAEIVAIIHAFKEINPSYKKWFGNKTQRAAADRLVKTHGAEKVARVVGFLKISNAMEYIPIATTPLQLEDKWAGIESALRKKKGELSGKKIQKI